MGAITMTLSAQEQGDFSVGGTIGVTGGSASLKTSTTTNDQTNTTNSSAPEATGFKLAPMFNYFVIDNLQLSAGLSYQMDKTFTRLSKRQMPTTRICSISLIQHCS